jgi:hypothetical protein
VEGGKSGVIQTDSQTPPFLTSLPVILRYVISYLLEGGSFLFEESE